MKRKFFGLLLGRRLFVILLLAAQLGLMFFLVVNSSRSSVWIEYALTLISILVVIHVAGESTNSAYKLMWIMLILIFPLFGGSFYVLFNSRSYMRQLNKKVSNIADKSKPLFYLPENCFGYACNEAPEYATQMQYLQKFTGFPVYGRTRTEYLSPGEVKFERLIETLKTAEKFIFLEYFSIKEGIMWDAILEVLKEKAQSGVDVRIMYDDVGSFLLLPKNYPKELESMGIQCIVFNPFSPFWTTIQNNRDHRKIAVIDGKYAFTGGVNLSDEYINAVDKHGHWKDAAVMLEGYAAWSFTLMFLQMWDMCRNVDEDISSFYPWHSQECVVPDDGLVQPYADSPLDDEQIGEHVYLQIIHNAKKYIYINTPYLVIDDSMASALSLAAKSGVDVRIVTPHRFDKWYVHMVTRSYYRELIKSGVKIYEYSDGFIHSKTFVSDDKIATVGTTNLDFRSLYLSFECGVWMHKSRAVTELYEDFIKTLGQCCQIMEEDCKSNRIAHLIQDTMRLFAPFM